MTHPQREISQQVRLLAPGHMEEHGDSLFDCLHKEKRDSQFSGFPAQSELLSVEKTCSRLPTVFRLHVVM